MENRCRSAVGCSVAWGRNRKLAGPDCRGQWPRDLSSLPMPGTVSCQESASLRADGEVEEGGGAGRAEQGLSCSATACSKVQVMPPASTQLVFSTVVEVKDNHEAEDSLSLEGTCFPATTPHSMGVPGPPPPP